MRKLSIAVFIMAFSSTSAVADIGIEVGEVDSRVRLEALERLAVLDGLKTVVEIRSRVDTMILGNVAAGLKGDVLVVCGMTDMKDVNGEYYGLFPFIGYFIRSEAAFIKMTFVPVVWPAPVQFDKVLDQCRDMGLEIDY